MSTAARYDAPNPLDIQRQILQSLPAMRLYHPGINWYVKEWCGNPQYFPPDLGGILVEHPVLLEADGSPKMVKADGFLHVTDRWGIRIEHRYLQEPLNKGFGPIEAETATAVVTHFTSGDFHRYGITFIPSNASDKAVADLKAGAKARHLDFMREWAETEWGGYLDGVERQKKSPFMKDRIVPPNKNQQYAREILDEIAEEAQRTRKVVAGRFVAPDHYRTDDPAKFIRHMRAAYSKEVVIDGDTWRYADEEQTDELSLDTVAGESTETPVRRGPGRPRKNQL
jgi:hypothetical protein